MAVWIVIAFIKGIIYQKYRLFVQLIFMFVGWFDCLDESQVFAAVAKQSLSLNICRNFTRGLKSLHKFSSSFFCQGVMEEAGILTGDNAFNAHFGECISAIGDIDDDGYQGQYRIVVLETIYLYLC